MSRLTSSAQQSVLALGVRPEWAVEVWDDQGLVRRVKCESAFTAITEFNQTAGDDVRLKHGSRTIRRVLARQATL